ncbi:septal ring lytic transglycosylase RlpA family protein [Geothrix sp. PMB-07]|uniref:septal ring lytic transglycosylase RlpA family protein n=1 Tax=Geothrix sp. PMB-07 TaxID=3068640 RepID=UPI00274174BA|nr:septal ring lytic transglycosylase RlpA family protein [Geothrix sp. PMB-07]WLT30092.1 septal ring lytic transglycosylase RlpA family protein [Geothrix sp. PMB-07]
MLSPFHPTNWSQACASWIHEIHIAFDPPVPVEPGKGGFLRLMRWSTPRVAGLVILSFTLHCTRPPAYTPATNTSRSGGTSLGAQAYVEEGMASWYGGNDDGFAGRPTASGEIFDPEQYTCAHRTLPLGSFVEVENLDNHRRAVLRVNDRGPFIKGRILDLSKRGAQDLGILGHGTSRVRLRSVDAMGLPTALDPAASQADPFVVQVASLSDPKNIDALTRELENTFGVVSLQSAVARNGQAVKRVRVGSYTTRQDAEQAAEQIAKLLKDRGVEPFITRQH